MTAQYFISLLKRGTNSEITYDKLFELYTRDLDKLKPEDMFAFELAKAMGYDAAVVFELVLELGGIKALLLFELELLNRRSLLDNDKLLDILYKVLETDAIYKEISELPNQLEVDVKSRGYLFNRDYFYEMISYGDRLPVLATAFKSATDNCKDRVSNIVSLGYNIEEQSALVINLLLFKKAKTLIELEERLVVILVNAFKNNHSVQRAVYYSFKVSSFGVLETGNVLYAYSDNLYRYLRVLDCRKGYQVICTEVYRLCSRIALSAYDSSSSDFKPLRELTIKQITGPYIIEELEDYYENNLLTNINRLSHLALTVRIKEGANVIKVDSDGLLSKVIRKGLSLLR